MESVMRVLPWFLLLATGCGENLTVPVREDYRTRDPEPLACLPDLDAQIDSREIQPAIGVDVRYLISPDGTTRGASGPTRRGSSTCPSTTPTTRSRP